MIKNTNNSPSFFSSLSDMLNQSHPLYQLADKIDWGKSDRYLVEQWSKNAYYQYFCGMQDFTPSAKEYHLPHRCEVA